MGAFRHDARFSDPGADVAAPAGLLIHRTAAKDRYASNSAQNKGSRMRMTDTLTFE
ncbi:hypothetical protein [Streptomyces avidinii]